ncbi:endonuclease-reverse transcriptase [Elysia marginata]|uniref:Endonuclease-reverse transcriptase n=1 Tax=Elysia marginata TaxID=1093978 RepID=A0AAV4JFB4_9GAST|nr:endonuclease-reverse transcriptase [Elysia marginata]
MSAAFHTIDRATLLNILETIIEEDELRLVRFLLSNTCLNIRIGGTKEEKKFTKDVQRRKQLSIAALAKLQNVWVRGDKLKKKTKLKLYRALVKSILTYNCSTWALTQAEEKKLDAFHRKLLKRVFGIRYPVKTTIKALYKQCNERPLSLYVLENRWRLFGHIPRRDREIPANKAMEELFVPQGDKYRGRPITTLSVILNNDLSRLQSSTFCLKTFKNIESLKKITEQRDQWRILCTRIQKAAEALQSDDYDAERR